MRLSPPMAEQRLRRIQGLSPTWKARLPSSPARMWISSWSIMSPSRLGTQPATDRRNGSRHRWGTRRSSGTQQPINRGLVLTDRTFRVEFASVSNRVYAVRTAATCAIGIPPNRCLLATAPGCSGMTKASPTPWLRPRQRRCGSTASSCSHNHVYQCHMKKPALHLLGTVSTVFTLAALSARGRQRQ